MTYHISFETCRRNKQSIEKKDFLYLPSTHNYVRSILAQNVFDFLWVNLNPIFMVMAPWMTKWYWRLIGTPILNIKPKFDCRLKGTVEKVSSVCIEWEEFFKFISPHGTYTTWKTHSKSLRSYNLNVYWLSNCIYMSELSSTLWSTVNFSHFTYCVKHQWIMSDLCYLLQNWTWINSINFWYNGVMKMKIFIYVSRPKIRGSCET